MHGSFSELVLVLRVICVCVRSAGVMERDRLDLARGTTLVVNSAVDHERCAELTVAAKLSLRLTPIASASSHPFARM